MSNEEATTIELAESACIDEALLGGVELLLPRDVPLGGPRAMPVQRGLPNKDRHFIGAWCFADHFGPVDLSDGPGMAVPPHPHTGLQTVSWLFRGEVRHRDSLGTEHVVDPGGLNIMTAGHGIAHSEYSPEDHSPVLHGVQLWVVLPAGERERAPHFEGLDTVPSVQLAGSHGEVRASILAGALAGHPEATAAARSYSPLLGAEIRLPRGEVAIDLDAAFEHGVLACTPGITVDDIPVPVGGIAYLDPGRARTVIGTERPEGIAMLLGGEPFDEEIVMFWNFIGTDHDTVARARAEWMAEREADSSRRTRFGTVPGDDGTLPSPRIPTVELLPRGRARRRGVGDTDPPERR